MKTPHRPDNPGPLEQTDNQLSPGLAKPEDFKPYCDDYGDEAPSVSGQTEDDTEASKRSNTRFNIGSDYKRITDINEVGEKLL
jgi:hypothetical protein